MFLEIILVVGFVVLLAGLRKQSARLKALEADLAALRGSLAEGRVATLADTAPEMAAAEPEAASEALEEPSLTDKPEDLDEPPPGPWERPAAAAEQGPARKRPDIETALGTRWAVWVGGLALALGGIFLVRYSIEAGVFGPGVRIAGALLFGLVLLAAGELARRTGFRSPVGGIDSAYIPAILTAAGAFTLFGAIYAAHGIYGFIGAAPAFLLLAIAGLGTLALALVHGQALAGLGLLGALATPALVASDAPNTWVLFGYLAIVLAAAIGIASIRRWRFLAAASFAGAGLWSLAYTVSAEPLEPTPVVFLQLVALALLALVWLRPPAGMRGRFDGAALANAILIGLTALAMAVDPENAAAGGSHGAAILLAALAVVAALRAPALPLLHAAGFAALAIVGIVLFGDRLTIDLLDDGISLEAAWVVTEAVAFVPLAGVLAVLMLAGGIFLARRLTAEDAPWRAASWAFWAAALPLGVLAAAWISFGDLDTDWRAALAVLALLAALAAGGECAARAERPPLTGQLAASILFAGAAAALLLFILAATGPALSAVLTGLAAALAAALTRWRVYPVLGWLCAGFAAAALLRVGFDPTIVGADNLGETPVFNALLPTYLVPAAAFAFAAWQLARTSDGRPRLVMEAFSALFAILAAAMLTRHAMAGGIVDAGRPSLAEQAIYTLIAIGAGAVLVALDNRSPSPVFRYGSLAAGVASVLFVAGQHFAVLNPLFTNESTGTIPVFNLLLIAYLLPAAAMAGLALYARHRRPHWYVAGLALVAAMLAFAYATLSVRRVFQGEFIATWKGMGEVEAYTYSAVWLALGVAILVAGLKLHSRILRLGSAALVVVAVAKVFLFDMSELEGVLRALSFIGLGAVLIGIGMFYQRMLVATAR